MRSATPALVTVAAVLAIMTGPVQARGGGHGFAHGGFRGGFGARGHFVGGRRHGNDAYVKAASEERAKLLGKLKSICRGC
jgi:hypothetical protein